MAELNTKIGGELLDLLLAKAGKKHAELSLVHAIH